MNIVRCLDTIDRLCSRPFPAEHGWSDVGRGGPGYFITELGPDAADLTADDVEACREAMAERLNERWGGAPSWATLTLRVRGERGDDIPEPWATLGAQVDEAYLWQAAGTGRWVAVGVVARAGTEAGSLLAVVTETDPP
ncbi:hypothetical protein [Streptomyces sp. NPDC006610]|jgi:hypothetical protein|uniref:hypothetical protein n=1 Tax=Streptomyces sp. NPDC006610 TaxID=3154584 RepID=UPI0033B5F88F